MKTKIEGILIRKTPYQDRHIIGELLLRSGRTVSVLFYGGQGGGKKQKSSTLELGYLIGAELAHSKSTSTLHKAKEWQPKWLHQSIRSQYQAFCFLCFALEVITKVASPESLHDANSDFDKDQEGLFKVLSNALFYLDQRCTLEGFSPVNEMIIFLGKLLIDQGVFPIRDNCLFCDIDLEKEDHLFLMADQGGFSCSECYANMKEERGVNGKFDRDGRELWELLGIVAQHRYGDLGKINSSGQRIGQQLFHFFSYQFQLKKADFKTLDSLI